MKKNSIVFSILFVLVILAPTTLVRAEDSPEATQTLSLVIDGSALLGIRSAPVNLSLSGATEAGGAIQLVAKDSTTRLLITNLVDAVTPTRHVGASLSVLPTGSELLISVLTPTTPFASGTQVSGTKGTDVVLSTAVQPIISTIGTCWSGTAADCGYVIKYTYRMITGATVLAGAAVTVTYTLAGTL